MGKGGGRVQQNVSGEECGYGTSEVGYCKKTSRDGEHKITWRFSAKQDAIREPHELFGEPISGNTALLPRRVTNE